MSQASPPVEIQSHEDDQQEMEVCEFRLVAAGGRKEKNHAFNTKLVLLHLFPPSSQYLSPPFAKRLFLTSDVVSLFAPSPDLSLPLQVEAAGNQGAVQLQ